ncbi:MAG: ureidoglycolate lyase [Aestuariivita sp.]|uniref:ureidoglycolate lyase n=1 Tax=Aestuariivita sp. TaxID=1872407 RepID=UPI003BAFA397
MSETRDIVCQPLTAQAFAPFGDVLEVSGEPDKLINAGLCGRYHDLAKLDFGRDGRAGISLFDAQPRSLPYMLDLLECHPEGSQAFLPMTQHPFLVIVSQSALSRPQAFLTAPGQGINLHRGTWHGVLTPLHAPGLFAVIDRIGETANLQEHRLDLPWRIVAG